MGWAVFRVGGHDEQICRNNSGLVSNSIFYE
jgi:hypothetical protein